MGTAYKVIAGIGMLIFAYLLLDNARATTSIISTFAENTTAGIKVLQGR